MRLVKHKWALCLACALLAVLAAAAYCARPVALGQALGVTADTGSVLAVWSTAHFAKEKELDEAERALLFEAIGATRGRRTAYREVVRGEPGYWLHIQQPAGLKTLYWAEGLVVDHTAQKAYRTDGDAVPAFCRALFAE